ncbi:mediator of RNA polymerase II transcription subunit 26-like isoform X2 [Conger conger]|uniref:mediator of RNA polymerase II transcription subunit 26-like isoform X2 n=1 Tax=Conger conger TaxID=82655 RepID=UPI002A598631|nr:mediator of RNA polymerase II transcription subunit 26-like isoform X2 [Conger conger]
MTAASATPQQMRDRLLQAIDSQSNIRNMVAVLEVISYLERYPITKEALEETRLGKLINDVRKKTKDEDLAKRAKKLLRSWQKLIEPGQAEATPRGAGLGPVTPGSANGGAHPPCRPEATPPRLSPELKGRNDFHNTYSPKAEKGRKRKGDARHSPAPPAKVAKATTAAYERLCNSSTPPPTNGVGGSPEPLPPPGEAEPQENDKQSRIPVNAVRPRPGPAPSTSSLLRAAVLQQHAKMEEPSSPRCVNRHPARSTPPRPAPSPPPPTSPPPPLTPPLAPPLLPPQHEASSPSANAIGRESDGGGASDRGGKRRKKRYRPRDYRVNLGGPAEGGGAKPVRLKERRLTFDPNTGQIRPLALSREPGLGEAQPEPLRTEPPPEAPAPPSHPSPFQQTNWKELSRNEIIQFYLSMQSSVLTSSGAQTPGAHFFMSEYLRREQSHVRETRKTHVLVPTATAGASREVTGDALRRAAGEHWPGVNGCYDTQGRWYDWTQCISLDPHGDASSLNILPYVCLD